MPSLVVVMDPLVRNEDNANVDKRHHDNAIIIHSFENEDLNFQSAGNKIGLLGNCNYIIIRR